MNQTRCRVDTGENVNDDDLVKRSFKVLGGCPRISIFIQIKVFWKNKRSHIGDIASIIFMKIT